MTPLSISIKRIDKTLPLPEYHTGGSVGFDLSARIDVEIKAHQIGYIPMNVIVEPPKGYWVLMALRSSAHKKGIMMANSVGIFDEDFCGDEDEYKLIAFNFTDKDVVIKKGDRIAQLIVVQTAKPKIVEMITTTKKTRGGMGSTGL